MLTPQRKADQRRVRARIQWKAQVRSYVKQVGWGNVPGRGRYWKRQLHRARRRYWKDRLAGRRGKDPAPYESTVSWRDT